MDLALLVYGISLLSGIGKFFIFIIIMSTLAIIANGIHYSDYCETTEQKQRCKSRMWIGFWSAIFSMWVLIFLPSEKTAYTMAGAYAAQKVAENDKVQVLSGKVLTIIEQKLDNFIDDGIEEAKSKLEKEDRRRRK